MDLKQIEYIVTIAEERNITRAAEKLFLTQSGLNQQLLKLERSLGTPLFYRSHGDCRPTEAGEIYLETAREMLRMRREAFNRIHDIVESKKGSLSVGFTPGRGVAMFSAVYPAFHHAYPDVIVEPMELSVHNQQKLIAQGNLDIGFMTLRDNDKTNDHYIDIAEEEIILAIPRNYPLAELSIPTASEHSVIDISHFKYEPFVLMYKESTIRSLVDSIFQEAGFTPHVLFDTSNTGTIVTMIRSMLCCGIIPGYYVRTPSPGVACFSLTGHPTWDMAVSYSYSAYLSSGAKEFIRLAKEYWA
mgnify:FL=1